MAKIRGKKNVRRSNGKRKSSAAFKPHRKQVRKRKASGRRGHRMVRNNRSSTSSIRPSTQGFNEFEPYTGPEEIVGDIEIDTEPSEPNALELAAERSRRRGQTEDIPDEDLPE